MRDFFWAPFLSLFSLNFYRRLQGRSLGSGFLYLGYLSLVVSLWSVLMFRSFSLPVVNDLVRWLGANLPEMTLTREGVRMALREPLLLSHPQWGPLLFFDPTSDVPKPEHLEKAFLVVARRKLVFRNPATAQQQIQDLTPAAGVQRWQDLLITGERVTLFWERIKPFALFLFFVAAGVGTYLWKLLAGLLYSLVALLLNCFRKERLPYGTLLNVTFFALTPMTLLQLASLQFPESGLPANLLIALLVTTFYLILGILGTQKKTGPTT